MKLKNKLKIEKFLKEQLWQLLIIVAFVLMYSWLFDKWIEAVMFCVAHYFIRATFNKQFHCKTTYMCIVTTLTIAWFGISTMLPLSMSLLSAIPMCFIISYAGYLTQDRIDKVAELKRLQERTVWNMTEDELRTYLYTTNIRNERLEFVVMILIYNMSFAECSKRLGYEMSTLKDWSGQLKKKLKIKSWRQENN